jgi:hypothetical protein
MAKKPSATDRKVSSAFHEVFHDKPSTVDTSKSAKGQHKQMVAIALSKARAAGANIPKKHDGGEISKDGVYELQAGEKVTPAGDRGAGYDECPHRENPSGSQGEKKHSDSYHEYYDEIRPEGASAMGTTEHKEKYADTQNGAHKDFLGRPPVKAEAVKDAECKEGVGAECARKQINGDVRNEYTVSSFGGKPYKA